MTVCPRIARLPSYLVSLNCLWKPWNYNNSLWFVKWVSIASLCWNDVQLYFIRLWWKLWSDNHASSSERWWRTQVWCMPGEHFRGTLQENTSLRILSVKFNEEEIKIWAWSSSSRLGTIVPQKGSLNFTTHNDSLNYSWLSYSRPHFREGPFLYRHDNAPHAQSKVH